jgi:hypothetical protein
MKKFLELTSKYTRLENLLDILFTNKNTKLSDIINKENIIKEGRIDENRL